MGSHRVRHDWSNLAAAAASVLAWRIPWTEEPGGLQSMGSQKVRHDWATNAFRSSKPLGYKCTYTCKPIDPKLTPSTIFFMELLHSPGPLFAYPNQPGQFSPRAIFYLEKMWSWLLIVSVCSTTHKGSWGHLWSTQFLAMIWISLVKVCPKVAIFLAEAMNWSLVCTKRRERSRSR